MPPSDAQPHSLLQLWVRLLKTEARLRKTKGDEAQVHKFRVRARRLAMASRMHPKLEKNPRWKFILEKVKDVRRRLGGIREIDVHRQLWLEIAGAASTHKALLAFFAEQRKKRIEKALPKIRLKEAGSSLLDKLKELGPVAPKPASAKQLARRFKKVFRAQRRFEKKLSSEALHTVRITLKKLRYSLEPIKLQLGTQGGPFLAWLKQVQDELGRVHDLATLQDALGDFRQRQPSLKGPQEKSYFEIAEKIQAAIDLGKSRWQRTWNEREKQLHGFMSEFGSLQPSVTKKAKK